MSHYIIVYASSGAEVLLSLFVLWINLFRSRDIVSSLQWGTMPSKWMCSGITAHIQIRTFPLCSPISSNLTMLNLMLSKKQSMLFYLTICKFSCEIKKSSLSDTRCYITTLSLLNNCPTLHKTFFAELLVHSIGIWGNYCSMLIYSYLFVYQTDYCITN